jgi:hypothetical protein
MNRRVGENLNQSVTLGGPRTGNRTVSNARQCGGFIGTEVPHGEVVGASEGYQLIHFSLMGRQIYMAYWDANPSSVDLRDENRIEFGSPRF